jgi:hypothetical protein
VAGVRLLQYRAMPFSGCASQYLAIGNTSTRRKYPSGTVVMTVQERKLWPHVHLQGASPLIRVGARSRPMSSHCPDCGTTGFRSSPSPTSLSYRSLSSPTLETSGKSHVKTGPEKSAQASHSSLLPRPPGRYLQHTLRQHVAPSRWSKVEIHLLDP